MIAVICPGCQRRLSIKDTYAGKSGTCPHCKERIKVPSTTGGVEKTNPSLPDPDAATVGGAHSSGQADEATLPPPADNSPVHSTMSGERLDFLAPPQGPGEVGRLGSYRVLRVLGAGGMGMVLQAEDPMLKRAVALKVMRPELAASADARERFLREAQATAAIEHPNIIHVYQVAEDRGVPFLAMPFLKGEAMDVRLKREPRLPVQEVLALGKQIAEGLSAAHKNGLVHRDIKPANIWLEPRDSESGGRTTCWVKILDFGLARALAGDDIHLTRTGTILGTPAYMSPEQAKGERVDHRCDLFSLGAVLYRMLTGELPFKGSDTMAILMALATEEPRPLRELNPDVSPELAAVVMRLLSKDPANRPESARAVADELASLGGDRTEAYRPFSPPMAETSLRPRSRWLLPVVGGGALIGVIATALILFLKLGGGRTTTTDQKAGATPDPPGVFVNAIGMKLVPIPAGEFWMGSPRAEDPRNADEHEHRVVITRPFFIGMHKATVGQFAAFVKETGYTTDAERLGGSTRLFPDGKMQQDPKMNWRNPCFEQPFEQTDDHPVVCVSRNDALAFCRWLTAKDGRGYALPTEAQWEYCCRAGSRKKYYWGDDVKDIDAHAWSRGNSGMTTHPVGQKLPNAWGLYDMHGNAWECVSDRYDKNYYLDSPRYDPPGPRLPRTFEMRGGGWAQPAAICRDANRSGNLTSARNASDIGFRVVLVPERIITSPATGMSLRLITPGGVAMGSPPKQPGSSIDELRHDVFLNKPFWIGRKEVTVGQFRAFVAETNHRTDAEKDSKGSARFIRQGEWQVDPKTTWRSPGFEQTDDHPVVCVSWHDAKAFCDWLSKKEGKRYTLPTEAQWERCCRAGSQRKFTFGDDQRILPRHAWTETSSDSKTHPVGLKEPNVWDLYDMHGNAWEWCSDWYGGYVKKPIPLLNPSGPPTGTERVIRGGGWASPTVQARSAQRGKMPPDASDTNTGFRVVRLPEEVLTNTIGMKLKLIPVGKFTMGSAAGEPGHQANEVPHDVEITRPFYLGVYKVTVKDFATFVKETSYQTEAEKTGTGAVRLFPDGKMKTDPKTTWKNPGFAQADDHPVVCVNWKDATAFCEWLSKKEGRTYTLPTEAQWEYCCWAGRTTRYSFGDDERLLGQYAWYQANSGKTTHPVGLKKPTALGLFDMHGNANEMVSDWYDPDYGKRSPKDDPPGPLERTNTILRGSGWNSNASDCRSARRLGHVTPVSRGTHHGFRVMLVW